jgi:hypothetical protein
MLTSKYSSVFTLPYILVVQCLIKRIQIYFYFILRNDRGARDSVVVKALCYKPEVRGLDPR